MAVSKYIIWIWVALLSQNIYAAVFYRHIPFNITLKPDDKVIVDYDISVNKKIYCAASGHFWITFAYKGHQKSLSLPVILQNDHVPNKPYEELADVLGQFTLFIKNEGKSMFDYKVNCIHTKRR